MATNRGGSQLPSKEANLFKVIVKSYETKQYKKGVKAADGILKKFPDHGETLSMKGLILNCTDRKSDAYELVRRGLKNDLKSHVCWHVYGLLYRSDRDYREAIKCYRNALRIDPDNIEILRDLSLLQAQMRDLTGFIETRQRLLTLKPNHRMNWIGFAVAHHLNANCSKAVEILEAYEGTLEDDYPPDSELYEHGEMLLYKISLLEECGLIDRALEEMHKKESNIVDKLAFKEQIASILVKLGYLEEGEKAYRALLLMNPDNYEYFRGLQKCLGLYSEDKQYTSDEIDRLDSLYTSLREQYKWSNAAKLIPLDFLEGERFREAADNYVRPLLTKGVPSLFSDLSPLYDHTGKLFLQLENSLRTTGSFMGSTQKEPPSTLMWTMLLISQHYDKRGQHAIALSKIDEAIEHTPTVIDLYSAKVGLAEKTAALFTKDGDQHNNLYDMQCMWYELAYGESYLRQNDLGRALKKFLAVEKHYADMTEDQFDFHSYCLRKMTLRAYVSMLKFQDRLHSHPYFHKAAAGAIRCYMKLHDSPLKSSNEEEDEMSKLPPSQRKKLRQKQRNAEARNKKEAEEKNEVESTSVTVSKSGKRQVKAVDLDPHGENLLQVEDPLSEATKYLKLLQSNSAKSLETHILSFELNMRKQKILLAFQAVKQLLKLDKNNPDSHRCLIKFFHKISNLSTPVTDSEKLIWSVLDAERPDISQFNGRSLIEANRSFLEIHKGSLMHRVAAAEMMFMLEPDKKHEAIKLVEDSIKEMASTDGIPCPIKEWKLQECVLVHKMLETVFVDNDAASRWKAQCSEYFPYSTDFEGRKSSIVTQSANNGMLNAPENGDVASHEA